MKNFFIIVFSLLNALAKLALPYVAINHIFGTSSKPECNLSLRSDCPTDAVDANSETAVVGCWLSGLFDTLSIVHAVRIVHGWEAPSTL
jgi:hypothetical protein